MFAVSDLAAYLDGDWRIDRVLVDLASGCRGAFVGTVSFEREPGGILVQNETGELAWGAHRGPAYRRLRMHPTGDPGVLEVLFDDGRPFHFLDLRSGATAVEHPCGRDNYVGEFRVESAAAWSYRWTVTGPAKTFRLGSTLSRSDRVPV